MPKESLVKFFKAIIEKYAADNNMTIEQVLAKSGQGKKQIDAYNTDKVSLEMLIIALYEIGYSISVKES